MSDETQRRLLPLLVIAIFSALERPLRNLVAKKVS